MVVCGLGMLDAIAQSSPPQFGHVWTHRVKAV
jgi:hypothetical protein